MNFSTPKIERIKLPNRLFVPFFKFLFLLTGDYWKNLRQLVDCLFRQYAEINILLY